MPQALVNTRVLALACLVAAPAWAADTLSGTYRGEFGALRFSTTDAASVRGTSDGESPCKWSRGEPLFTGRLEGNVLLGRLKLCQTGPGCGPASFMVMALHDAAEGTLSGHLAPVDGSGACQPAGLSGKDRHFVLRRVGDDPSLAVAAPAEGRNSAALVAARRLTRQEAEAAERAFAQAGRHMAAGQHRKAVEAYERGLALHDSHAVAWGQLGAARMKVGNASGAIEAWERAVRFGSRPDPQLHFRLATAWARLKNRDRAVEQVRLAVDHGFPNPLLMRKDRELNALLGSDPEFNALLDGATNRPPRRAN